MLFVRLLPIFPSMGQLRVRHHKYPLSDFLLATMIGMLPYDFALTNAVVEVGEAAAHGFKLSPVFIAALTLLAFVSLVPFASKIYG